jgi:hypothetical protein
MRRAGARSIVAGVLRLIAVDLRRAVRPVVHAPEGVP